MQVFRTFSSLFIQQILHIRSPHTTPPSLTDRQFHPIREHERLLVHALDLVHIDQNTVIALKKPRVTSESLHRPLICIGTRKANTLLCKRNMQPSTFDIDMLWSSVFVTRVSNKLMSNTSLRMAYDSRYKNAVVHGCMRYKQNAPLRDREIPHLDTHEDKFLRSSAY